MSKQSMQAIRVHQYGSPDMLQLEQVPRPEPQAGEVLVQVYVVGVLPIEWKVRQGLTKGFFPVSFPYIPGSAVAGVVEQVGPGVTQFEVGQAVFGRSSKGAYAEYTIAAQENLASKPDVLSFEQAATISGGATVAWAALFENAALQAEQRILIHGAAGGVGSFAVQFAARQDARVIGTTSSANEAFVRSLGAETVIDYGSIPFEQVVQDVDVVLDTIGGETLRRSMQIVKPGGIVVSLLEQPSQDLAKEFGIRAMKNAAALPFPSTNLLQSIAQLIIEGQVKATVMQTFPLHQAGQAHMLSQQGHGRGRIVLVIS